MIFFLPDIRSPNRNALSLAMPSKWFSPGVGRFWEIVIRVQICLEIDIVGTCQLNV